ncbi:MAG TPA: P-loop NTPase, partial [Devosia sp.]|nr:P-loop NTPase [Devosia sp.]
MADAELVAAVKAALGQVEIPGGGTLGSYSGLSDIIVTKSAVALAISVQPGMEAAFGPARIAAQAAAQAVAEGRKVMVSVTSDKAPPQATGQAAAHGRPGPAPKSPVPGIRNIIVVGSGKGGVGKSTVAVNLALAFAAEGLRTGLLDADLYGPSVPKLLGIEGKPAVREDGIFTPHQAHGLKVMSIGSMLSPGQA